MLMEHRCRPTTCAYSRAPRSRPWRSEWSPWSWPLLRQVAKGALGAPSAPLLVGVFFSISVVAVSYAARVSPQMMAIAAMVSYLVKVIVIMVDAGGVR